jgi:5-methylcytosine-specific restriction endonuclease McrA
MDETLAQEVRERAGNVCEYCRLPKAQHLALFEIEHIIPKQHGGPTSISNLAYACIHCNRHKGPNLSGIDWVMSRTKIIRLFHPRRHKWGWHFRWEGPVLVGRTPLAA